ncbi:MAG: glycoside hydrolase family 113 [Salinivenus sp.]
MPSRCSTGALGVALVVAGVLFGCAELGDGSDSAAESRTFSADPALDIRSVTLDARNPPEPGLLSHLRNLGVTHLTLVPFGWQRAADDPQVRVDTTDGWYSESHRGIRALARRADTLGMDVILKPHLWVGGYDEAQDRSDIGFETDAEWRNWENEYRRFLMTYARLAAAVDADLLVLGTELTRAARERPAFWRALADTARTVYEGELTYAANWHNSYDQISFWDALDYVGVQAYFPLSDADDPPLDTLRAGWQRHKDALAAVHRRTDRPVLLTELGYRSAPTAAEAPWRWPEEEDEVAVDTSLQARCYRAFFSTAGQAPWLAGAIAWKWHPAAEIEHPTGFTPQGKPAERVLRRGFTEATGESR